MIFIDNITDTKIRRPAQSVRRILGTVLLYLLGTGGHVAAATIESSSSNNWAAAHEDAVVIARAGQTDAALQTLARLLETHPEQSAIRYDYAVVAAWHGDDALAHRLLADTAAGDLPTYVLARYAKSARDIGEWARSQQLYEALARRPKQEFDAKLGQVLVAADSRSIVEGEQLLSGLTVPKTDSPQYAQYKLACGYLHERDERASKRMGALACYNQGLRHHPEHVELRKRRALIASAMGAASVAQREAAELEGALSATERERIELDAAAMRLRWGATASEQQAYSKGEDALLQYESLAKTLAPTNRTLMFDRFVALVGAFHMRDAGQLFEQILQVHGPSEELPAYIQATAGKFFLHEEQPELAIQYYQRALQIAGERASANDRFSWQLGLFSALADAERYQELAEHVQQLEQQEQPWFRPDAKIWKPNRRFALGSEAAAMSHGYREDYHAALERLDNMLAVAPANGSVRLSRAAIRRWRGWYSQSEADVDKVSSSGEYLLRSHVDRGHLALDTQAYDVAEESLSKAQALHVRDKAVVELAERWQIHSRPQLLAYASTGHSDGGTVGNRDYQLESYLYSEPIRQRFRAFAHGLTRYAKFDEGTGRDTRAGVGVEFREARMTLQGEVNKGFDQSDDTGLALSGNWWMSDHWYVEGAVAMNSSAAPLRGVRTGIGGDEVRGTVGYRWHESRQLALTTGGLNLDDGNRRRWVNARFRQRVLNQPRHKLNMLAGAYASRNGEQGAIYFNPESDRELSLGLQHEWRIFRDYDRQMIQRVGLTGGTYYQENFGSDHLWRLQFEHDWQISNALRFSYGASVGRRPYDGVLERQISYFTTLGARL